jgi:5-methyltetrahydropteroyltriglutamate--homocysteine methyltransferase
MRSDDIGSFPLPEGVKKEELEKAAFSLIQNPNLRNEFIEKNFLQVVKDTMRQKIEAGIDVPNYPQHQDMNHQFLRPIEEFWESPYLIKQAYARIPEIDVVNEIAKEYYEEGGKPLELKVCITGPLELYLNKFKGSRVYPDLLERIARSISRFVRNSRANTKRLKTSLFSIDEPRLGLVDLEIEGDSLIKALEISSYPAKVNCAIHLHSTLEVGKIYEVRGINIIASDFAANPRGYSLVKRRDLETYDKFIRAGIARTDIDSFIPSERIEEFWKASEREKEVILFNELETKMVMRKRAREALKLYKDRVLYLGPDCGLATWPSQRLAFLLLKNTSEVVKNLRRARV